ncbi:MAG: aminotransferase class III-fold pyridoxal phosphate-dependent enzyme [Kordiimonadaceae bacterium]|nr:aminotransferase class III-fold pyridoxal phosphate-dependent enzyme [Kordiimonadaceae bacterium]
MNVSDKNILSNKTLAEIDRDHHIHPFADSKQLHETGVRVIEKAAGVYLWDDSGKKYLDSMSGLWCVNVGYDCKELMDAALEQMQQVPYYNTFFGTTTAATTKLARKIASLTPEGLDHVFFTNSGSEANDTIVKAIRFYWNLEGKPAKKLFISRDYGYHGVTTATASLSGLEEMHPQSDLPLPNFVEHIEAPYWYKHGGDMEFEEFGLKTARALETKILEMGADNVAAFIGEPIYGAGGVMVPPKSYWPEINRICKKYDVLLVADEVVCGFGRTGEWFGSQTFGIEPDVMTIAKGLSSGYLPIAAAVFGDRIADKIINEGGDWVHGFTYSGHPTCAAVALKNLELLDEGGIMEKAKNETGPYFQAKLAEFSDHPLVGEVRGSSMIAALELVEDKEARKSFASDKGVAAFCRDLCLENGLIIRAARDCLMTSPPLIITNEEIDEMMGILRKALDETYRHFS